MKPVTAFAVGLWAGAVIVLGVGAFNWRAWKQAHSVPAPELLATLEAKEAKIQLLRQQVSSLSVEVQQLRRSVLESKSQMAAQTAANSPRGSRRIPFRRLPPAAAPAADQWVANAVAQGDAAALTELEEAASQNNGLALEGLAWLADRDGGAALMRVWGAPTLTDSNRALATRLLAETVEANPQAEEWLRGLFATPDADQRLLVAALAGLAAPTVSSRSARLPVDVPARLRLFDLLRVVFADDKVNEQLDQMRTNLTALALPPSQ
jgi:hypothetical protein